MTEISITNLKAGYDFEGNPEITLTIPKNEKVEVQSLLDLFKNGKKLIAKIGERKKRRSLDANAYLWVICDKIAKAIETTKEEVYKDAIRHVGVFEIMPIKLEALERWMDVWENSGIGAYCRNMEKSKIDGYTNVICYYGSSKYDVKEMARLIDYIVGQAKEIGIETMPPEEIERLKNEWKN